MTSCKRLKLGILVLFLMVAGLSVPLFVTVGARYRPQIAFDPDVWRSYRKGDPNFVFRQRMIKDVVTNILPGRSENEILSILGPSLTKEEMRRMTVTNTAKGTVAHPESGYYFDDYGWDLLYPIGKERIFIFDHTGQAFSPDEEYLLIRLDQQRRFTAFSIVGSDYWKRILAQNKK